MLNKLAFKKNNNNEPVLRRNNSNNKVDKLDISGNIKFAKNSKNQRPKIV